MAQRIVDWDELYPGRFFKAGTLAPNERRVLTITDVQIEELEGESGKKQKGILSFQEDQLQLPLNKTNGICLREMFGRVPYKWVGKRFAIFASEWAGEPCIRIWGSPDIAEDMPIVVQLPRKKPIKMVMHAMGDERSLQKAAERAATRPSSGPNGAYPDPLTRTGSGETLGDRCIELMKLMQLAKTDEDLMDIEADYATETFNARETTTLTRALAKRRVQVQKDAQP